MKGALGWALLLSFLAVAAPASALRQSLDATLDYELEGDLAGTIVAHEGGALVLGAADAPGEPGFHLRGGVLEAMIIRSYSSRQQALDTVLPLLEVAKNRERGGDQIAGNTIDIERRTFDQSQLRLLLATDLWHVAVFDHDDLAGPATISLPAGEYGLANAPDWARLTRSDLPQPAELRQVTDPAQERLPGSLEVRARDVSAKAQGDFYALLYGGTFEVATADALEEIVTGRYEESYTDDQGLPARRTVNATMLLRVADGLLESRNPGPAVLYAPEVHVLGTLGLRSAAGFVDEGEGPVPVQGAARTFQGDLRLASAGHRYKDDDGVARGRIALAGWVQAPASSPLPAIVVGAAAATAAALAVRFVPGAGRWVFAGLALFSMAGRHDVLENATRSQIVDLVRERPGTSLSSLQRGLGLGWGTMSYHVALLERTGLLVTKRAGGKRLLFAQGDSRIMEPAAWGLLQNPSVRRLAHTLLGVAGGITQADLARRLDCSTQYVGRLLRRLEEQQLVAADPLNGRLHVYRAGPRLVELAPRLRSESTAPADSALAAATVA